MSRTNYPPKPKITGEFPPPPLLADPHRPPGESVPVFINWASRSGIGQREEARKIIAEAHSNPAVAEELCRQISAHQRTDFSRTLIELSVLGEMRNEEGEQCLVKFLHQPFPREGTVVNGEIVEQTTLGGLQSKAVDGLAYAGTKGGDREVLWAAGSHPSRIVRAEAINAYLWNRKDSDEARATLEKVVRPDERIFLKRPRYQPEMSSEEFNEKLEAYAKAHPAPKPSRRAPGKLTPAQGVGDRPVPEPERKPVSQPPQAPQNSKETK
ncbi:MAG: hypothetical protein ACHP9V_00790 [Terriglobales bacterium]